MAHLLPLAAERQPRSRKAVTCLSAPAAAVRLLLVFPGRSFRAQ
jgi:hypothetical protein